MILKNSIPYVWLCAFLCSLFFINDWQLELFYAAVMIAFVWAIISLVSTGKDKFVVPKSWVLRIMGLFWFLVFLSIFRSDILNISVMAFCFFTVMPLTFFVLVVQGNEKYLEVMAQVMTVVFAGLAIWALLQFFVFSDYFAGRARHPLANPNSLAALFNLFFFASLGWMLGAKKKSHSNMALGLCLLIFGGIVATGSRGAFFAMVPMLLLFLFVTRGQARNHWKCLTILLLGSTVLFALSTLGAVETDNLSARVTDTLAFNLKDITSNRMNLWLATFAMIKEHGLFGTGIGTYFLYFPEFRLAEDAWGAYYAHSDPLQFWVELGVLGPVLFYAFIAVVIGRTILAFQKTNDVSQRVCILAPFCALGSIVIHTHVTFNFYNLSILFGCGFLLAVWFLATQKVLKTPTVEISFPEKYSAASKIVSVAMPFVFIGALFSAYIISEAYTNKARAHLFAGELERFADDIIFANKIGFQGNYRSYILAVNVPLSILEGAKDELNETQRREIFDQALSYLQHVRMINPRSSSALYYLAKIQSLVPTNFIPDDLETAQEYYTQALKIDPMHLGSRIELSKIYEGQGEKDKMLKLLEKGMNFNYTTSKVMDLYALLLKIYIEEGNQQARDNILQKMRSFQARLSASQYKQSKSLYEHLWSQ